MLWNVCLLDSGMPQQDNLLCIVLRRSTVSLFHVYELHFFYKSQKSDVSEQRMHDGLKYLLTEAAVDTTVAAKTESIAHRPKAVINNTNSVCTEIPFPNT